MTRFTRLVMLCGVTVAILASLPAPAVAERQPVQLSLFSPIQIFPPETDITGLRINLIYGRNHDVQGVDWGLVNHVTGSGLAWQIGVVGFVENDFMGWQDNWAANVTRGTFTGFQSGIFNRAGTANGVELGWVNYTESMNGLQIGLVNWTKNMHGLQIGVGNIIEKNKVPFLPIVNFNM